MKIENVECPEIKLNGLSVRTNMEKAQADCVDLWEKFTKIVKCGKEMGESYGVSLMINESEFDYIACLKKDRNISGEGFVDVTVPAGLYVKCGSNKMEDLPRIYEYVCMKWGESQTEYEFVYSSPSYELYYEDFQTTGRYDIFFNIKKRS